MSAEMTAAVSHGPKDLRIEQVPIPKPGSRDVLVRVHACGISANDGLNWMAGSLAHARHGPHVGGSEFAGYVVDRGSDVTGLQADDLVVSGGGALHRDLLNNRARRYLPPCYGTVGWDRDGGFAQFCCLPASECLRVDSALPDTAALAQPMAVAMHAIRRSRLQKGETVAVVGLRDLGAFVVAAAVAEGARVIAIDTDSDRLGTASALGASQVVTYERDRISSLLIGTDIVFSGPAPFNLPGSALVAATSPWTRLVFMASGSDRAPDSLGIPAIARIELEIIGSQGHRGTPDLRLAAQFLAERNENWSSLAPLAIPLSEVADSLRGWTEGGEVASRTLVDPWVSVRRATETALPPPAA